MGLHLVYTNSIQARYTGDRLINPAKSAFQSAEKTTSAIGISHVGQASNGSVKLFHFKPSQSGAYNIYTTGSRDTVGSLFVKNTTLGLFHSYNFVSEDDNSGTGRNFRIEEDLKSGKSYFAGARGLGNTSGTYYLKVEKNLDYRYAPNGGTWIQNSEYYFDDQDTAITRIVYTKEQTALYYEILREEIFKKVKNYMITGENSIVKIVEYLKTVDSLIGILEVLKTPALIGLINSLVTSIILESVPTTQSGILYLQGVQQQLFEYSGAESIVSGSSITIKFKYGVTEQYYYYYENAWYTVPVYILGMGWLTQAALMQKHTHSHTFTRSYSNFIYGIELQRGEILTNS